MRAVLDANVLVSGLLSRHGAPGKILEAWGDGQFDLVLSTPILDELERVVHEPWNREKYNLPGKNLERFLRMIGDQAILVRPSMELNIIPADPPDNRYLECAKAGEASYLVTGDGHLLELEEFEGVVILPPAGFLAILEMGRKKRN
jgi:putative PIN family toxin of toxin-antitoxin system